MLQNASASTDSLSREAVKGITLSLLENFKMVKEQNKDVLFLRVILNYLPTCCRECLRTDTTIKANYSSQIVLC
jgi:hypothetical protein